MKIKTILLLLGISTMEVHAEAIVPEDLALFVEVPGYRSMPKSLKPKDPTAAICVDQIASDVSMSRERVRQTSCMILGHVDCGKSLHILTGADMNALMTPLGNPEGKIKIRIVIGSGLSETRQGFGCSAWEGDLGYLKSLFSIEQSHQSDLGNLGLEVDAQATSKCRGGESPTLFFAQIDRIVRMLSHENKHEVFTKFNLPQKIEVDIPALGPYTEDEKRRNAQGEPVPRFERDGRPRPGNLPYP